MPMPAAFHDAMLRREFWVDYLFPSGAEWPAFGRRCHVAAPVGGGYEIVVELTSILDQTDLYLRRPGRRKLSWLGRNDLAYWPRDVLRWDETLLICEAASRLDAEFATSDVLLVLLYPFTPLTDDDDRQQVYARMRKAFKSLGVLSARLVDRCVRECLSDATGSVWWRHARHGWVLKQGDSMRYDGPRRPGRDFPFKYFAELIEAAHATCQRLPRRAAPRRAVHRRAAQSTPRPKPNRIALPDGVYTRAQLKSARLSFAPDTPAAQRKSAERALKKSVEAALAAIDAVEGAQAVTISHGRVAGTTVKVSRNSRASAYRNS